MENRVERAADPMEETVYAYGSMLYRLCFVMLGNAADAEDVVQETFLRCFRKAPAFRGEEHKKAWLPARGCGGG